MNKTAVITGASRGIGLGIANVLAQNGYNLALICKNNITKLNEIKVSLERNYHITVLTFQGDVSNPIFIEQLSTEVLNHFKKIDVLINNAGISHVGLLADMTYEQWDNVIGTNLSSIFYTSKAFIPTMISQKSGNIINISSMWGTAGASCEVAYSASKGGVNSFTKALAKELAPSNIAVNAIACGVIDTDMNAIFSVEEKQALIEDIPCDRLGTPEDIGKSVLSLINAPNYLTGQIIGVDGGYL